MSISVKGITKFYGKQKALNDVSFKVNSGEILGFLGPNGAGKSTMMKILTCYIPQSEGSAEVCGKNVTNNSIEVRKKVGYLPEHNPLYYDMYVEEYLRFIAGIHKIKGKKSVVNSMIEKVGLTKERRKKIGALSRGYKQRVGLAQAMIHDPEVLILDEPTSGLDPIQLEEIRRLIKDIGKEKTVMLSTHIMQEVEALCNRIIIIKDGEIVANDSAENLQSEHQKFDYLIVEFDQEINKKELLKLNSVHEAKIQEGKTWVLSIDKGKDIRQDIFKFAVIKETAVLTMQKGGESLEETFKKLAK